MATIPLLPKLNIFSNIDKPVSGSINCIYENFGQPDQYVTQRTGFTTKFKSNGMISGSTPNGIFKKTNGTDLYIININNIYHNNYSNLIFAGISTLHAYMCQNEENVFINTSNLLTYYIDSLNNVSLLMNTKYNFAYKKLFY